jgi:hypothetical protein
MSPDRLEPTKEEEGWRSLPHMSVQRAGAASLSVNNRQFLILGGIDRVDNSGWGHCLASCEYYDSNTKGWRTLPIDMPRSRLAFGAASIGENLFVFGGEDGASGSLRDDLISIHVPDGDLSNLFGVASVWKTLAPMSAARDSFAFCSHGGSIYVFGGRTKNAYGNYPSINTGERYDPSTNTWKALPKMPDKRQNSTAVVVGDKIYVVGGEDHKRNQLRSTLVFDTTQQEWESPPSTSRQKESPPSRGATFWGSRYAAYSSDDPPANNSDNENIENAVSGQSHERQQQLFVPDMKTHRDSAYGWGAVVAVEHFIFVMGGIEETKTASCVIEVLDTKRNVWKFATPMNHGRALLTAGYLKASNEIVVAGGFRFNANTKTEEPLTEVESIDFDSGLFPPGFRFREKGQTILGDTEQGTDGLGMKPIADVLAETLVFRDLRPPFVLGVLGKWGRGKSYFVNLMLDKMIRIQKQQADDHYVRDTYVGHVYYVEFNAWTFSRGDIWSSLLYQILESLNEQIQLEGTMDNEDLVAGRLSTIEVVRNFGARNHGYITTHSGLWEDYKKIKKRGNRPSKRLLRAIDANYENDQRQLKSIDNKIKARILELGKKTATDQRKQKTKLIREEAKIAFQEFRRSIFEGALKKVLVDNTPNAPEDNETQSANADIASITGINKKTLKDYIDRIRSAEDYDNVIEGVKNINWWSYRFRCRDVHPFVWICSAGFLILSFVLFEFVTDPVAKYFVATFSGLLSASTPIVTAVISSVRKMDPIIEDAKTKAATLDDIEIGTIGNAIDDVVDEKEDQLLNDYEQERAEILNRNRTIWRTSLNESIEKIVSKQNEHLGMIHPVQQDLKRISDGMLDRRQKQIFPRGEPRIVLFVDDLDRCRKSTVVEVIEALQLLVKNKLFVVVLAVDPSYAINSIDDEYRVLDPENLTAGIDFLEKVIQIPFRLSGFGKEEVGNFVKPQMEVEVPGGSTKNEISGNINNIPSNESSLSFSSLWNSINGAIHGSSAKQEVVEESLPRDKIAFTPAEVEMTEEIFEMFGAGPRCMKRIINVFKLIKVIWRQDTSGRFKEDEKTKRAIFLLMLLASGKATRDATHQIFGWMEGGTVEYHHVIMRDEEGVPQSENNLASLFARELEKGDSDFALSSGMEDIKQGTLMSYIKEYLSEYKWTNSTEWNEICSQFLLARCFSFFRLVSKDVEESRV